MASNTLSEKLSVLLKEQTMRNFDPLLKYEVGKHLFSIGERPKGIYFVSKGCVKIICENGESNSPLIRMVGPGEIIGYTSLIKRCDYTSSAIIMEEAEIRFISKQIFLNSLQTDIGFANIVIATLCDQLVNSEKRIIELITKDAKQRLATLLLSLDLASEEIVENEIKNINLPKKDIAGAIAVTPETLSRYLADFKKMGLINLSDNSISVLNRSALLHLSKLKE